MRRAMLALLVMIAAMTTSVSTAQEPARLALLIGNKGYTAKVGVLKNPHNDVDLVAASLTRVGFKVTVLKDATYKQMDTALKRYVEILPQAEIETSADLGAYEIEQLDAGYEGIMVRSVDGHYKYGRSTENEGLLWKVKRFDLPRAARPPLKRPARKSARLSKSNRPR